MVCAGSSFSKSEIDLFESLKVKEKIVYFEVDDNELAFLYSKAKLFVFPSLYEGFGIPILEAFNCGCPVALSNTSCFPEVAGNAAVYFDPTDEKSILNAVESVIYDEKKANSLRKKGFEQAKNFSWEKTAKETKKVYQKAMK